ncbi:hypothetical protein G7Y89_g10410 [Cudoniella acicularis]|uniref:Clr5 domain-containing protein n=1 Tax=Cudoniella acicularis TaxID=354080 RepID=A0A8H4RFJ7_9HELO|nr:hypothetical protein G7Y89_g10410 [Cudoniella acicularis]
MDLFELSPVPAAFTTVEQNPQAEQSPQHPFIFHEAPSGDPKIREMTRQQWESLKSLIQRIYIDENKPFRYVAKVLREEHSFEPTKRQFSRQIEKWGFRKNVSRSERRMILEALPRSMNDPLPDLQDGRLKAGRLKNWRRRYREEVEHDAPEGLHVAEAETYLASDAGEIPVASSTHETLDEHSEGSRPTLGDATLMDICQDMWPFDWSTVGIPGSPELARLFKGLEIESAADIPSLSLESESDGPSCLSNFEIQEVFNGKKKIPVEGSKPVRSSRVQRSFVSADKTSADRQPQYPWRNIQGVFCGYATSPHIEVYVFPSSPPRNFFPKPSNSGIPVWTHLEAQEAELQIKLGKLKKQFPEDSPAVLAVMENIADVFHLLSKYKKAEFMYRRLVDIYRRNPGPNKIKVLEACQNVITLTRRQGHSSKAKKLNDNMRSIISKLVQPHHPLAIQFARNDAKIAEDLGQIEDSERIRQEAVQITLLSYGPRHPTTIKAISTLGFSIVERGKSGGEKLLRTAVQLLLEDPTEDDDLTSWAMDIFTWALNCKGAAEESYHIATKAVAQFGPVLGRKHRNIINLENHRGWSLLSIGKLVESERLFRDQVDLYSIGGETHLEEDLAKAWYGLASVLSEMGNIKEASGWYEKYFQRVSTRGAAHHVTIANCYKLADWYEVQGRLDDALRIYHQTIDNIRGTGEDPNGSLAGLESAVRRTEEQVERRTSCSSVTLEESKDYKSESSDSTYAQEDEGADEGTKEKSNDERSDELGIVADEKAGEERAEKESEREKEDWRSFLHEDFLTP